jgi:hypothetical protein
MRQLKYHERKLLKKVDFLQWKNEHSLRELQVRARGVSILGGVRSLNAHTSHVFAASNTH